MSDAGVVYGGAGIGVETDSSFQLRCVEPRHDRFRRQRTGRRPGIGAVPAPDGGTAALQKAHVAAAGAHTGHEWTSLLHHPTAGGRDGGFNQSRWSTLGSAGSGIPE